MSAVPQASDLLIFMLRLTAAVVGFGSNAVKYVDPKVRYELWDLFSSDKT